MHSQVFLPFTLNYQFESILDIGTGPTKNYVDFFSQNGKKIWSIAPNQRITSADPTVVMLDGMFETFDFPHKFDAVWASHVLEHTRNPGIFLDKIYDGLKPAGVLFVIVPPHKNKIVGGHVTAGWNIGLLMYNLILAGFDVKNGRYKKSGYNVAAFVQKRESRDLPRLRYDNGDIEILSDFWPNETFRQGFEGDVEEFNWF